MTVTSYYTSGDLPNGDTWSVYSEQYWCVTAVSYGVPRTVHVDDDGRNRTIGRSVRPSDRVEE